MPGHQTPPDLMSSGEKDPGVRLVALETRQKLRDEHVDRRFDAMTTEFSSLDKRVSSQIAGLDHKIELGFRSLTDELRADRNISEMRVAKLYDDWKVDKDSESKRPASIKLSLLLGLLGVVFPTLSIAAVVIMLVVQPVDDNLTNHIADGLHGDGERRIALIAERAANNRVFAETEVAQAERDSSRRHAEQQEALSRVSAEMLTLQEHRVLQAERWGRLDVTDDWLRDDIQALKADLVRHQAQSEHTTGTSHSEVARLQGVVGEMSRRVDDMDNKGSRFHNESAADAARRADEAIRRLPPQ